ncbi:insulinase family protein [Mangrovimonas sp. AS39]|uniref:M16 family metallopeptidase n=1 Tax=Mangrovimonas futianensis TaxID=2895523 RepID=UPI001E61164A|nr:pitrilysin family protein [Mangrovimonas futianensis]MCF1192833.1 insulinase family protein [Mangrovimonas futianensis]MCF1196565.1 insulinase family protein [Mangrovimonas futianensis]
MKALFTLLAVFLLATSCNENTGTEDTAQNSENTIDFKIPYEKFTLDNGLEVILHEDHSDPIVAVATMMHVGSNREKPGKTGFAHFFEHMSFNDSENVPVGANRKLIPEWGGQRNGGTWSDGTVYYEVVPKDAFEKILWIDSDRFGYMINTVTEAALEREKQVVKNEKRQRVDNSPYGYTDEIIRKNLYPEGHPYNWTVIGQLPDLQAATIDDVKEFYAQYYGAKNASLVIAGDIDIAKTKELVEKWFGEINSGPDVEPLEPMPVTLTESKSLYFEDTFAKLPELRMVFPTVEEYHPDTYALNILGNLLSGSKKAPLYQVLVEEKKLTPNVGSYQSSSELAGEFVLRVRANNAVDLDSVKIALDEGLKRFETNGVEDKDLKRIKAELETQLYQGVSTVLNKAFQLVQDNEFNGDPSYITQTANLTNAVTKEDVMRVYNKYIKGQNYVMTSVVPKGQLDLAVANSKEATVWMEEVKQDVAAEEVGQGEEADYEKTHSKYDRSEPPFGDMPLFQAPEIYKANLDNGLTLYGIENNEVPLVQFEITIPGGHLLDSKEKSGVANLLGDLMMEGTATKTPAELEEAIGMLGASISFSSSNEDFRITGSCLSKNLAGTVALVKEMLLEPRWDSKEFSRLQQALETSLKGREAEPRSIASINYAKLLYGDDHIFGIPGSGTLETTAGISLEDLKAYYVMLSPENAKVHVVGDVSQAQAEKVFAALNTWKAPAPEMPSYTLPESPKANTIYFIDVPDSKQSVLYIGKLALSAEDADFNNLEFANEVLGSGSSGMLTQTLRIEKGYTYGAYSGIAANKEVGPFYVITNVRANATLPSLEIIQDMLTNYGPNFSEKEVEITKNKILKDNTRAFESLGAKMGILRNISKYDKPLDYIEKDQEELISMTVADYKEIINKYLKEKEMIYVIVGDKSTQWDEVKKLGKPMIELDIHGNQL